MSVVSTDHVAIHVVTPAQAAELLTLSRPVLERMRRGGTGPKFIRLSARRIGYRVADITQWLEGREKITASDTGDGDGGALAADA